MEELFLTASAYSVTAINLVALIVIVYGTIEAAVGALGAMLHPVTTNNALGLRFVRFGRWLVAGLTFQLAADVIETATTTTAQGWEDIARLASIAVIRTFLSFFLERDMREMSAAEAEPARKTEG